LRVGTVSGGRFIGGRTMVSILREERGAIMDLEALESEWYPYLY